MTTFSRYSGTGLFNGKIHVFWEGSVLHIRKEEESNIITVLKICRSIELSSRPAKHNESDFLGVTWLQNVTSVDHQ